MNKENIEEYLLLLVDKELDEAEAVAVMNFLKKHPEYQAMLDAYLATRLEQEVSFVFPDKESLLKRETEILPFSRRKLVPLYWAAALILLLGLGTAISLLLPSNENIQESNIAVRTEKGHASSWISQPVQHNSLPVATVRKRDVVRKVIPGHPKQSYPLKQAIGGTLITPIRSKEENIEPLEMVSTEKIAIDEQLLLTAKLISVPEQKIPIGSESSLPQWLPVNEDNLQGVNDLIARIQILKENVQEKTRSFKNTNFVIRLGEKEIPLGNKKQ